MAVKELNESSDDFKAIKKEWLDKAKKSTLKSLPKFLKELTEDYKHDYGTICHAIAAASIAAAWSVEHSKQGGITGFQASCIMWQFIRDWQFSHNKTGLCLVDYDNFLYPQYEDKFDKTLSSDTWEAIQKEAKINMNDANNKHAEYIEKIKTYKIDIKTFVSKYSDYYERREYYDPLGMATLAEFDAEEKKKESGFEFAPQKPYEPVNNNSPVYLHWLSILNGKVPFGYSVAA